MSVKTRHLVWIDLEMTGLNPDEDRIIEIATVITDLNLKVLEQGPVLAIHQEDAVLNAMDEWNTRTHGETGLVERVRASSIDEREAEELTLQFVSRHVKKKTSPLCGNSICQDRRFLCRHMPRLEQWLHYRNLDVSTLKALADYWFPGLTTEFVKRGAHEALSDIMESIAELRFYRRRLMSVVD